MFGHNCGKQVFSGITEERFAALQAQASANGIPIAGDSGSATTPVAGVGDITMTWDYDRAAQRLTLQCTDKPMLIPCGMIASELQKLIDGTAPRPVT